MSLILNIETSTTVCSVALAKAGQLIDYEEVNNGYTHAENLHTFIDVLLKRNGLTPNKLGAVAVSKGPGSYTGLRIGVSAAKGLAYALNIPLISIGTLENMTVATIQNQLDTSALYCPMLDARRMEVYTCILDAQLQYIRPVSAEIINEHQLDFFRTTTQAPIYFFGDGMPKSQDILRQLPNSFFIENIIPSAISMCELSWKKYTAQQFEDVAYFEPFYLKEFLITKKAS